jgi:hypothetical protein
MIAEKDENSSDKSWCKLPPNIDPSILLEIETSASKRMIEKNFTAQDVLNISNRQLDLIPKNLSLSPERLEKLRRLCQLWEVDIRLGEITSHRKIIGPVIVAVKKVMFPIIRFMLKDLIREQRDFNSAAIRLFADLCNENKNEK